MTLNLQDDIPKVGNTIERLRRTRAGGFVTYTDDVVEIFEGQDKINDIDLKPEEPAP